jgi:hypothetical protein
MPTLECTRFDAPRDLAMMTNRLSKIRVRSSLKGMAAVNSVRPFIAVVWITLWLLGLDSEVRAQVKTPFPDFTGKRVYVAEVPDRYGAIADQITRLERSSPQTYYVVVVRSAGEGRAAARNYVEALYDTWRRQAAAHSRPLDPERSVIMVMALENHQVAVHTGTALRGLGLRGATIDREVVEPSQCIKLAQADKYPEAIAALLYATNNWIAERDSTTRKVPVEAATHPPVAAAQPSSAVPQAQSHPSPGMIQIPAMGRPERSMGREVAVGLGISVLLIFLAVAGLVWLAQHRARSRVNGRLKELRSRTTDLMDHLDALKERLKLLPVTDPDYKAPMAGETLALYNAVQEKLGKLWDRWLQVMDEIDKAQKLAATTVSPLNRKPLQEADTLLEQKGVFESIETEAQACTADLDRLNQAHEAARAVLAAIGTIKPKLDAELETVKKLTLPTAPYQDELGAIVAGTAQTGAVLTADPIGASGTLDRLRSRAEALVARLQRVSSLWRDAEQVRVSLEEVKGQVADHRVRGLKLSEEGGNPDHFLGQGDQSQGQAMTALRAGDPDKAAKKLETARTMVHQAQATIEQVQKAQAFSEREQPNRVRETQRLRAALPQAESYHRSLEQEFAPSSWHPVARNLDQARMMLATFDRMAEDAAVAASSSSQKYLAGQRLLEQLAQQQQVVLRLMSGLGEQLNALAAVRGECRKRRAELETRARQVGRYLREHDPIVGEMARSSLAAACQGQEQVLVQFDEPRPDWPAVCQALAQSLEEFSIAQTQAEADVQSHEQLSRDYDSARRELERVANLLSGRREDRPAANQHFRAAAEVLDRVGLDLAAPHGEWARLLEEVRGAVSDLEQAERLAHEDIRLAGQAQSEVAEAARSIRQAHAYFAMGVTVDTSAAEAAIEQAEQLLNAQEYEQAIQLAGQAAQQARQAYQAAVQQASWRQMQADADRRRWKAGSDGSPLGTAISIGAAAAATAASVLLDNMAQAAPAPPDPSPPAEPLTDPDLAESPTSLSTWESDSGQGNW